MQQNIDTEINVLSSNYQSLSFSQKIDEGVPPSAAPTGASRLLVRSGNNSLSGATAEKFCKECTVVRASQNLRDKYCAEDMSYLLAAIKTGSRLTEELLFHAIKTNNYETFAYALKHKLIKTDTYETYKWGEKSNCVLKHILLYENLPFIKIALENKIHIDEYSRQVIERSRDQEKIKSFILFSPHCPNKKNLSCWTPGCKSTIDAARNGHVSCLQFLLENGLEWFTSCSSMAANKGHLDILKFAVEKGLPLAKEFACGSASATGKLECLMFVHANGCKITKHTIEHVYGVPCMQYLIVHMSQNLRNKICAKANASWLMAAIKTKSKLTYKFFYQIIKKNKHSFLKYAVENGSGQECSEKILLFSIQKTRLECIRIAIENKINISERCRQEIENSPRKTEILEIINHINRPELTDEELAKIPEDDLCIICYGAKITTVLYPCQHKICCLSCVSKILASDGVYTEAQRKTCPKCREQIVAYCFSEKPGHFVLSGC